MNAPTMVTGAATSLYGMPQVVASVRAIRADTIRIATDVPAERYDFRPTPDARSIAETLVHIASLWSLDRELHGGATRLDSFGDFDIPALVARWRTDEAQPRSKAEIIELLRVEGERHASWLERIPRDVLAERMRMPGGGSLSRFELLIAAKEHEVHHRAQLTVLQRLIGLVPHFIPAATAAPDSQPADVGT
jgi:uncharacterized damage-inducible protein DinB